MRKFLLFLGDIAGWISALLLLIIFLLAMLLAVAERLARAQMPAGAIVEVAYTKQFCKTEKDITACTHADILFQGIAVEHADSPAVNLPIAGPVLHPKDGDGWEIHWHQELCKPIPDSPYFRCYAVWFRKAPK